MEYEDSRQCPLWEVRSKFRISIYSWYYKGGGANRTLATSLEAELRQGCGSDGPRVVEHESDVPMLLAGVDF